MGKHLKLPKGILNQKMSTFHNMMDDDLSTDEGTDDSYHVKKLGPSNSSTHTLDTDSETSFSGSSVSQSSSGDEDIENNDDQRHEVTPQSTPFTAKKVKSTTRFSRAVSPSSLVVQTSLPQPSPLGLRHRECHIDLEENSPHCGRIRRNPSQPHIVVCDGNGENVDDDAAFLHGSAHESAQHHHAEHDDNIRHASGQHKERKKMSQEHFRRGTAKFIRMLRGHFGFKGCLLLASCIIVGTLILFQKGASRHGPRHVLDKDTKMKLLEERKDLLSKIRDDHIPWSEGEAYSVQLLAKSGRVDLIRNSLDAHSACSSIRSIQVHWDESAMGTALVPNAISNHPSGKVEVLIGASIDADDTEVSVSSSAGKKRVGGGDPNAVLLLSDDLVFTCDELDRAFKVWTHNPDRMVGFFPYQHKEAETMSFASMGSSNDNWVLEEVQRGRGEYTILSDRAAFVHKDYITSHLSAVRTGFGPCDTFGLSLGITSTSFKPPIAVLADPLELRSSNYSREGRKRKIEGSEECLPGLMESLDLPDLPLQHITYIGG
mmetsp:Transcript_15610/g.23111  ORF Transcript_15610/g.23111 Transcript_15610/m.23111 type:complete len:544 (-) Transcript_15610:259-1890(-)